MPELLNLSPEEQVNFKKLIIQECIAEKTTQIKVLSEMIASIKDSMANDTKSSAGDKHETSRENASQTLAIYENSLRKAMEDLMIIENYKFKASYTSVDVGAVVVLEKMVLFILDNFTKMMDSNLNIMVASSKGPFVQRMLGKSKGYEFEFNNQSFKIIDVF